MRRLILKELQSLAVPAGVVLAVALVARAGATSGAAPAWSPLRSGMLSGMLFELAFFVGPPTIAAWSLGTEFRHGTLTLLLSQPVSRSRVWLTKWLVSAAVMAAVMTVEYLLAPEFHTAPSRLRTSLLLYLAVAASAPLATVVARSTVGGMAVTLAAMFWFELPISYAWAYRSGRPFPSQLWMGDPVLDVARVAYAAFTAWLGWRAFAGFETVERNSMSLSASAGSADWSLLRARRSGVIANLVRKELVLFRPLFLVAAVFVVTWLLAYAFTTPGTPTAAVAAVGMLLVYVPIAGVLSGTISMAEEMSLGVRAWQLTVPVAARTQWAVKLVVCLSMAFMLVLVLPATMAAVAPVGAMPYLDPRAFFRVFNLVMLVGIVLLGLWSAALFADGVAAAVGSIAVGASLLLLAVSVAFATTRWDVTPTYTVASAVAVFVPTLGLALWQSYAAFRRIQLPRASVLRLSLALAATAASTAIILIAAAGLPR
jgi:hypothetical protein